MKNLVLTEEWASQVALEVKNPPANAGDKRDTGSVPRSGRSPGGGHGNPLQWTEEPSGLQSMGWQRVRLDRSNLACTVYYWPV